MANKLVTLLICFIVSICLGNVRAYSPNIDRVAVVTTVFDVDTFVIDNNESIRFADVDTPEFEASGYQQAKDFATNLVLGKIVHLDIDNLTTTDQYGRFVSVVYFDYNLTHYGNLNKALLVENLAVELNFTNNEFSPISWSLYVPESQITIPEFPITVSLVAVLVAVSLLLIIGKRKLTA